eukprot:Clim_evm6s166 gene=Clim_evmTU6s166
MSQTQERNSTFARSEAIATAAAYRVVDEEEHEEGSFYMPQFSSNLTGSGEQNNSTVEGNWNPFPRFAGTLSLNEGGKLPNNIPPAAAYEQQRPQTYREGGQWPQAYSQQAAPVGKLSGSLRNLNDSSAPQSPGGASFHQDLHHKMGNLQNYDDIAVRIRSSSDFQVQHQRPLTERGQRRSTSFGMDGAPPLMNTSNASMMSQSTMSMNDSASMMGSMSSSKLSMNAPGQGRRRQWSVGEEALTEYRGPPQPHHATPYDMTPSEPLPLGTMRAHAASVDESSQSSLLYGSEPSSAGSTSMHQSMPNMAPMGVSLPSRVVPGAGMQTSAPGSMPKNKVQLCRFYQQGHCKHGDRCQYLHEVPGIMPTMHGQMPMMAMPTGGVYAMASQSSMATKSTSSMSVASTLPSASMGTLPSASMGSLPSASMGSLPSASMGSLAGSTPDFVGVNLYDMKGNIYAAAQDQQGCRFLQRKLDEGDPENFRLIYAEVKDHLPQLMVDPFGNYLCQRLLDHSNTKERAEIVHAIRHEIVPMSLNMHGTRALQKLIEQIDLCDTESRKVLIDELKTDVVKLVINPSGNHVIQRCLQALTPEEAQFIFDAVANKCREVATHRHGCCVLQRCIDRASPAQRQAMIDVISDNALPLIQDAYGNYVLQYVLNLNEPRHTRAVIQRLLGSICLLSIQKYSSNAVEKCFEVASKDQRTAMINELIDPQWLRRLVTDPFANYVIQKALKHCQPHERETLVNAIRRHEDVLCATPYGRKLQLKINKEYAPPSAAGTVQQSAHSNTGSGQNHPNLQAQES